MNEIEQGIGTVEPIYDHNLDKDAVAFIVGAIVKYADSPEQRSSLVAYLRKQVDGGSK